MSMFWVVETFDMGVTPSSLTQLAANIIKPLPSTHPLCCLPAPECATIPSAPQYPPLRQSFQPPRTVFRNSRPNLASIQRETVSIDHCLPAYYSLLQKWGGFRALRQQRRNRRGRGGAGLLHHRRRLEAERRLHHPEPKRIAGPPALGGHPPRHCRVLGGHPRLASLARGEAPVRCIENELRCFWNSCVVDARCRRVDPSSRLLLPTTNTLHALDARPQRLLTVEYFRAAMLPVHQYLIRDYEMQQRRAMGAEAVSRMLSTHLYYRRGFPFYTFNIVGGLDEEGACRPILNGPDVLSWPERALGRMRRSALAWRGTEILTICASECMFLPPTSASIPGPASLRKEASLREELVLPVRAPFPVLSASRKSCFVKQTSVG